MTILNHKNIMGGAIHPPHRFEFADSAARISAIGFIPDDLHKLALDLDTYKYYTLKGIDPIMWSRVFPDAFPSGIATEFGGGFYAGSYGYLNNYSDINTSTLLWVGVTIAPNEDVYACVYDGDIYKQAGGVGPFVALGQGNKSWQSMTSDDAGNIYCCVYGGDIYKQIGGVGNFVALSQTVRNWRVMTCNPTTGDIYCAVYNGGVFKQTVGAGDFVMCHSVANTWIQMAADPKSGDIFVGTAGGRIDKLVGGIGGVGDWLLNITLNGRAGNPQGIACDRLGNMLMVDNTGNAGQVKRKGYESNTFRPIQCPTVNWRQIAINPAGTKFVGCVLNVGIKKADFSNYALVVPSSVTSFASLAWRPSGSTAAAGTQDPIDGWVNTQALVGLGIANFPAAQFCKNFRGGGFDDWFLPSTNELLRVFKTSSADGTYTALQSVIGNFALVQHWTSYTTLVDTIYAYSHNPSGGGGTSSKTDVNKVMPMRKVLI